MDRLRGVDDDQFDYDGHAPDVDDRGDPGVDDTEGFQIGNDERRMHVRAYNHWVSLLGGRAYPSIEDLDPENIADFGPNSVLLDFTAGLDNPEIRFLGQALRDECGVDTAITHINQVPSRSLLSRLTDHYLQIIANRAPIGFEAEFVGIRGHSTMYRGILMPFSSNDDTIDFIYGVINWKELVDADTQAMLNAEIAEAVRQQPPSTATAPAWASGPSAEIGSDSEDHDMVHDHAVPAPPALPGAALPLADQLVLAQQSAAAVRAADTRSRAALYRALGRAHDFAIAADADPEGYAALLDLARITPQARAPMTPIAKLVFGADYDKTRLTEFAAVLAHAHRANVPAGALADFLDMAEGGIKGIVAAERALRRGAASPARADGVRARLAALAPVASIELTDIMAGELIVLVARRRDGATFDIIGTLAQGDAAADRAIARVAR